MPIALGILVASGQVPGEALEGIESVGELALDGRLRPISGVLPLALAARKAGRKLIVPRENADEAALAGDLQVLPAEHLLDVMAHLLGQKPIAAHRLEKPPVFDSREGDLAEVRGQHQARRALEIAAAGSHNLLISWFWRPSKEVV